MRRFFLLPLLFALAACANPSLQELRSATPKGTPFQAALAVQSRAFAEDLERDGNWDAAGHFADKGLQAAYGHDPEPEALDAYTLKQSDSDLLAPAREALLKALTPEAEAAQPEPAAKALTGFDAWVQSAATGKSDEAAHWREIFDGALASLQKPPETPAATEDKPAEKNAYLIFFATDRSGLDGNGERLADMLAEQLKKLGLEGLSVSINGHTDTTGSARHNLSLSQARAKSVVDALAMRGIPHEALHAFGFGETDPRVPTPDNTPEPQNRRVEIYIGG